MKNRRLIIIMIVIAFLLCIPLVAMQFTKEVDWNWFDFLVMGILMMGTGLLCELVMRWVNSLAGRILICGVILLTFFLIWAELAVGIFGTPFAGS